MARILGKILCALPESDERGAYEQLRNANSQDGTLDDDQDDLLLVPVEKDISKFNEKVIYFDTSKTYWESFFTISSPSSFIDFVEERRPSTVFNVMTSDESKVTHLRRRDHIYQLEQLYVMGRSIDPIWYKIKANFFTRISHEMYPFRVRFMFEALRADQSPSCQQILSMSTADSDYFYIQEATEMWDRLVKVVRRVLDHFREFSDPRVLFNISFTMITNEYLHGEKEIIMDF
uniref:Uncharacterized protein n=1 Tax=Branchiostoma floridae TaxID=7739 RepID=C3ZJQ3_BRAFL|eukprot:XP_002591177.1 hypothetical protein BRAFLDRAFT_105379 [Branchiostoma floridae]